jgi:hypothetical protein
MHLVPQPPDQRFVGCLFQHLELTLLASASQDSLLLSALQQPDPLAHIAAALQQQQCFQRTLQRLAPQPPQQQPGQPQQPGQACSRAALQALGVPSSGAELVAVLLLALVQGHGPKRLSEALHVERPHGMQLAQALAEAAPGIGELKERLLRQALEGGCWGRRRARTSSIAPPLLCALSCCSGAAGRVGPGCPGQPPCPPPNVASAAHCLPQVAACARCWGAGWR